MFIKINKDNIVNTEKILHIRHERTITTGANESYLEVTISYPGTCEVVLLSLNEYQQLENSLLAHGSVATE